MVLVSAAAVLVAVAIIVVNMLPKPPAALTIPPTSYSADLTDGDALGRAGAPVTMEIYSDFQCPFCGRLAKEQLYRYVGEFVKPGTLRIVAHDIDIVGRGADNPSIRLAVGARCAAEQDRYWQYHDLAFWNQQPEESPTIDAAFIASLATAAGVDKAAWDTCIARGDVKDAVAKETADTLAKGVNSTPTMALNGTLLPAGIQDYDQVAAYIRQLAGAASPGPSAVTTTAPSPATSPATSTNP
jgi:protein-disulfide isomerase